MMLRILHVFVVVSLLLSEVFACFSNDACPAVDQCKTNSMVCITISVTDTPSLTYTETESKTFTLPTPTETFTETFTNTMTVSKTLTLPTPTDTFTMTSSRSKSLSLTPSNSISLTPTLSVSLSATASISPTVRSKTNSLTLTLSLLKDRSLTGSVTQLPTRTTTNSNSISKTLTLSPSLSISVSGSMTNSKSISMTALQTRTKTSTESATQTKSTSGTISNTLRTRTETDSLRTRTETQSITGTETHSLRTRTETQSMTQSETLSLRTRTETKSETHSITKTYSITKTQSMTKTPSLSDTISATKTESLTNTISLVAGVASRAAKSLNIDNLPPPIIAKRDTCSCSCVTNNKADNVRCNDLDVATFADQCQNGVCLGTLSDSITTKLVFARVLGDLTTANINQLVVDLLRLIDTLVVSNRVERYVIRICGSDAAGVIDSADCAQVPTVTSRGIIPLVSTHTAVEILSAVTPGTGTSTTTIFNDGFVAGSMVAGYELTLHTSTVNIVDTPVPPTATPTPSPAVPTYGSNIDPTMVVFLIAAPILLCLVIITISHNHRNKRAVKRARREVEAERQTEYDATYPAGQTQDAFMPVDDAFGNNMSGKQPVGRNPLHGIEMYNESVPRSETAYGPDENFPDEMSPRTCAADEL